MRLHSVDVESDGSTSTLTGHAERRNGERFDLFFSFTGRLERPLLACADAFLPALLVPAMLGNEPLESDLPVSPRLLWQQQRVQGLLSMWYPEELHTVSVEIPGREGVPPRGGDVGSFFSAGVDSFHTAIKSHQGLIPPRPVTHLIFMKGFDAGLANTATLDESERHVHTVAARLGLELLSGRTNVRDHMRCLWPEAYQGAAMGAAGLALTGSLGYINIPATYTYADMGKPWGSHPLLDESWSSESVTFTHEGCATYRYQKIRDLAEWDPSSLDELRVCLSVQGGPKNCGQCSKCVRTMVALAAIGKLGVRSFPKELPPNYAALIQRDHDPYRDEMMMIASGPAGCTLPGLEQALKHAERRRRWRSTLRSVAELSGVLSPLRAARDVIFRHRPVDPVR